MTKIIPTKFDNTHCRLCNRAIAYGENVRWTKGQKGVTCVTCPGVVNTTTGEPVANETAWESLSRRFNIVQAEANTLRGTCESFRKERDASQMAHVRTQNVLGEVQRERNELQLEVSQLRSVLAHELKLAAERNVARLDPTVDPAGLIEAMAPGGIDAWIAHDLQQIAEEKAAARAAEIDSNVAEILAYSADDDCPI